MLFQISGQPTKLFNLFIYMENLSILFYFIITWWVQDPSLSYPSWRKGCIYSLDESPVYRFDQLSNLPNIHALAHLEYLKSYCVGSSSYCRCRTTGKLRRALNPRNYPVITQQLTRCPGSGSSEVNKLSSSQSRLVLENKTFIPLRKCGIYVPRIAISSS